MSLVVEKFDDLGITRVSRWIWNCYVIHHGDEGPIVVDAGLPKVADDLEPLLRALPPLQAIVATHGHSDHVAGAALLASRHGGTPVHLPSRTLDYLAGETPRTPRFYKGAMMVPTFLDQPFDRVGAAGFARGPWIAGFGTPKGMVWTGPPPAGGLVSGQLVPGASSWKVIAAPGHTDDSLVLWSVSSRTLISGDAVVSARGRAVFNHEIVDACAAAATTSMLRELPVAHLLPGHGRPVHDAGSIWKARCA